MQKFALRFPQKCNTKGYTKCNQGAVLNLQNISMFAFGLGTCRLIIIFGMFGKIIPKRYNKYITRASTVLIVTLGLLLMTKGLKLL